MTEHVSDVQLAAWRWFLTAHVEVVDRIERDMLIAGAVPLDWYDILIELAEAPDRRLRLHQLASSVVLTRSRITRLVDRLEAAGLLRREAAPDDRRGAYAVITAEGLAALRTAWPTYATAIGEYFARHLSEDEAQTLAGALERVVTAARAHTAGHET